METPLRTVVVGIGETEKVDPHLAPAVRLAQAHGATLHAIHAYRVPDPLLYVSPEAGAFSPEASRGVHEAVLARLEGQVAGIAPEGGVRCHAEAAPADAAIIDLAETVGADLIVVGATRRGAVSRTLLGTTAQRVLRAASVPVLVSRRTEATPLRKILLTTDLSDMSAAVYERAVGLVTALSDAKEPEMRTLLVVGHDMESTPSMQQHVIDDLVEGELAAFLRRVGAEAPAAQGRVRIGDAATEIVAETEEWGADLLVLGTHGRGGVSRFLIGSVAETVTRGAPCDMLVIPATVARGPKEASQET